MKNNYLGNENEMLGKPEDIVASGAMSGVIDMKPYTGVGAVALLYAGITDTDATDSPTCTVKLQTAADTAFSSAADISGATFTAISDSVAGEQVIALDAKDVTYRYLRAYCTIADTPSTNVVACTALFPERNW